MANQRYQVLSPANLKYYLIWRKTKIFAVEIKLKILRGCNYSVFSSPKCNSNCLYKQGKEK